MGGWGANCHLLLAPFERTIWRYREDFVNIDISEEHYGGEPGVAALLEEL